jgi:hypothetical protein
MNDQELTLAIKTLKDNGHLGPYPVTVAAEATQSKRAEMFTVEIWKFFKKGYKLQWEQNRNPKMPQLKSSLVFVFRGETRNSNTYLTSGYDSAGGGNGMRTPEEVVKLINFMKQHGVLIDV